MRIHSSTLIGGVFRAMYETPSEAMERLNEAARPIPMSRDLLDLTQDVAARMTVVEPWLPRPTETVGRHVNVFA